VRTTASIIVWARETGRAALLRRDRREGLQAVGQAGKARARTAGYGKFLSERTDGRNGTDGRQRGLACGRECGPHNAGCMRATHCKPANIQVGGVNGTGQVDNGTPDHTDTVKAWTRPTSSDAFGITSFGIPFPFTNKAATFSARLHLTAPLMHP
jgi:hypothetical protein